MIFAANFTGIMVTENMENKKSIKLRRNLACGKFNAMDKKGEYPKDPDSQNKKETGEKALDEEAKGKVSSVPGKFQAASEDDTEKHSFPSQKNLEKEISDYLTKKYGGRVKVISQMVFPKQVSPEDSDITQGSGSKKDKSFCFDIMPEELEAYLAAHPIKEGINLQEVLAKEAADAAALAGAVNEDEM